MSYTGLLVDWGGVMTTDLFASFRAFCEQEDLSPDAIGERFRTDRASRELLIGLETGDAAGGGVRAAVRRDPGRVAGPPDRADVRRRRVRTTAMQQAVRGGARGRHPHRPDLELLGDEPL